MSTKLKALIFFILGFISLFWTFFAHLGDFDIPLFGKINADLRLNIEGGGDFEVLINNKPLKPAFAPSFNSYKTFELNNYPVYKISIKGGKNFNNAVLSVGHRIFYFKGDEILKEMQKKGEFIFPDYVKYYDGSKFITDMGFLHKFFICFLSIFYNPWFYFISFIWFFFAFFSLKNFPLKHLLWAILALSLILRLSNLTPSLWADEIYSVYMGANPLLPLNSIFSDPGNPPFYYLLLKIWLKIFNITETTAKIPSIIFSLFANFLIYKFLEKENKKIALFASFLFAINIYSIVFAQEVRCYSLCIALSCLLAFLFFKLKNAPSNKFFILYFLTASISFNTHYYMAFLLFANFILGLFILKNKVKFFITNALSFLTFLPFLFIKGLSDGLNDPNFNVFQMPDLNFYIKTFETFSYGKLASILVVACVIFMFFKKEKYQKFLYSFYLIFSTFLLTYVFSLIKPIAKENYFVVLLPFFVILTGSIPFLEYGKKRINYFLTALLLIGFLIPNPYFNRERARLTVFDGMVKFASSNSNGNSALIFPYLKEVSYSAYRDVFQGEYLVHPLPITTKGLIETIEGGKSKIYYVRITKPEILFEISKIYKTSFVRLDKDLIIARILKNE